MQNCDHTLRTLNFIRRIKETPNVSVFQVLGFNKRCNLPRNKSTTTSLSYFGSQESIR